MVVTSIFNCKHIVYLGLLQLIVRTKMTNGKRRTYYENQ